VNQIRLAFLSVILLLAQEIFCRDTEVCNFAMAKTNHLIPDLCEKLDSNQTLYGLWNNAKNSSHSKKMPGLLLAGGAFLFGALAVANASDNVDRCGGSIVEGDIEKCRKGDPVLPFMAVSGVLAISDIILLCWPNSNLETAMKATSKNNSKTILENTGSEQIKSDSLDAGKPHEINCDDIRDRVILYDCNRNKRQRSNGK
jgi:hypothetical protein